MNVTALFNWIEFINIKKQNTQNNIALILLTTHLIWERFYINLFINVCITSIIEKITSRYKGSLMLVSLVIEVFMRNSAILEFEQRYI